MQKTEASELDAVLQRIREGDRQSLYLVVGDRVLAEPAAIRIGEEMARSVDCTVQVHRRPPSLTPLLSDLRTFSLFAAAKVLVAIESAVLADAGAVSALIDEALEAGAVEVSEESELSERQRRSASRLLQALRLHQLDPLAGSAVEVVASLPESAFAGAPKPGGRRRRRGKRQIEAARDSLASLLEAARAAELEGWAETELGELADIAQRGLPPGHSLVLAESFAASDHPVVEALVAAGSYLEVGQVGVARGGGWQGVELLARELERETGVSIAPPALAELARRTLQRRDTRAGSGGAVSGDSTARLAGEYRKLATLVGDGEIGMQLVQNVVEDRGEEDAWKTLDAIGAGRAEEALGRVRRLVAAAEDPVAARLSFFSLLAGFARQLTVLSGLIDELGVPRQSMPYPRFKNQIAPRLQADLSDGRKSPVAGLHAYRLYRAFTVACRIPSDAARDLPQRALDTELRLKGESGEPDVALSAFICDLTASVRSR